MGSPESSMWQALSLLCLSVAVSAQNWPAFKTTFSINPFAGFYSQPRTSSEAEAAGWELVSSCDGKFLGHRYADPQDFSLVLIFDDAGYIAGSQSVVPLEHIDSSFADLFAQPAYQLGMWYDTTWLPGDLWEHPDEMAIGAIVDHPPSCLMEMVNNPGLTTMHHYFYEFPQLTLCPLKYQRNEDGYRKLMEQF